MCGSVPKCHRLATVVQAEENTAIVYRESRVKGNGTATTEKEKNEGISFFLLFFSRLLFLFVMKRQQSRGGKKKKKKRLTSVDDVCFGALGKHTRGNGTEGGGLDETLEVYKCTEKHIIN